MIPLLEFPEINPCLLLISFVNSRFEPSNVWNQLFITTISVAAGVTCFLNRIWKPFLNIMITFAYRFASYLLYSCRGLLARIHITWKHSNIQYASKNAANIFSSSFFANYLKCMRFLGNWSMSALHCTNLYCSYVEPCNLAVKTQWAYLKCLVHLNLLYTFPGTMF
jgi:hypothetical protein